MVVGQARKECFVPANFPYAEAQQLFTKAAQKYNWKTRTLPLSESAFRATLSPQNMVKTRVGTGGPQPAEVKRMLKEANDALAGDQHWANGRRDRLAKAESTLDNAFGALLKN